MLRLVSRVMAPQDLRTAGLCIRTVQTERCKPAVLSVRCRNVGYSRKSNEPSENLVPTQKGAANVSLLPAKQQKLVVLIGWLGAKDNNFQK